MARHSSASFRQYTSLSNQIKVSPIFTIELKQLRTTKVWINAVRGKATFVFLAASLEASQ
jgi:hypothetical protein